MADKPIDMQAAAAKLRSARGGKPRAAPRKAVEDKKTVRPLKAPDRFDGVKKEIWDMMAKELARAGITTALDRFALERLVELTYYNRVLWKEAEDNHFAYADENGNQKALPEMVYAMRSESSILQLQKAFGMLPDARGRMRMITKPGDDPFVKLIQQLAAVTGR